MKKASLSFYYIQLCISLTFKTTNLYKVYINLNIHSIFQSVKKICAIKLHCGFVYLFIIYFFEASNASTKISCLCPRHFRGVLIKMKTNYI